MLGYCLDFEDRIEIWLLFDFCYIFCFI